VSATHSSERRDRQTDSLEAAIALAVRIPAAPPEPETARAVIVAMSQPEEMDVNEIIFRHTRQEL